MEAHFIGLETLKLLVQVAWADRDMDASESALITSLASQVGASEQEASFIRMALEDEGRMPAPNLDLLRGHYDDVMQAVDQIITIDQRIVDDERAVRDAVASLLSES